MTSVDSFKYRQKLVVGDRVYHYFSLKAAEANGLAGISRLPYSLKVVLENLLRHEDGRWHFYRGEERIGPKGLGNHPITLYHQRLRAAAAAPQAQKEEHQ